MSRITVSIAGSAEISALHKQLPQLVEAAAREALLTGIAEPVKAKAINRIRSGAKTGKQVKRHGALVKESAPGEAPADDTDQLAQSLFAKGSKGASAEVGSPLPEALYLEKGTVKMAARPFLAPAIAQLKPDAPKIIADAIGEAIAKHARP
jgi:HK97 gp10 family phage protein